MKRKSLILGLTVLLFLLILSITNTASAAVNVTRNVYSNDGSMKFNFTGLTLDTNHEYQFGLTKTVAAQVTDWYSILVYTNTTATVDILSGTTSMRNIIQSTDTGYITIKDKTTDTIVLKPYAVDLKIPYLQVTNYTVLTNGKEFGSSNYINVPLRNAENSKAYYQYEKITDTNIISKYKEIKAKNGDYTQLQSILKTTLPNSNWTIWNYWNGYMSDEPGFGCPQDSVQAPDTGLYYMWVYFSGANMKPIYGYILVDNLEPEIELDSISLPKTGTVKLGKTLTLTPTFNPSNTTNKIVTWKSSNESVATVDNAGRITPKKIGSTIITVTSQDGKKKATCTVTVTAASTNNGNATNNGGSTGSGTTTNGGSSNTGSGTNSGSSNSGSTNSGTTNKKPTTTNKKDNTTATGKLPQTGLYSVIAVIAIAVVAIGAVSFKKYRNLRGI